MGTSHLGIVPSGVDGSDISSDAFEMILTTLKQLKGFNLDIYKDKCIKRRIAIRIRKTGCATAREYAELLMNDPAEPDLLLKVITIHVSQFFRNPSTFEKLKNEIFPSLFARCDREGKSRLAIRSIGCAGGEEPYSLALILKESFPEELGRVDVSILATDIDQAVLETARSGLYREDRLAEVPPETRERWFTTENGISRLSNEIREIVTFRQDDIFRFNSLAECDMILCRNVLIYLERVHQERILRQFADALPRGGILVLGKSETLVGASRERFQAICPIERIYRTV